MKKTFLAIGMSILFLSCNGNNNGNKNHQIINIQLLNKNIDSFDSVITDLKYPGVVFILSDSIEYQKQSILIRDEKEIIINRLYFNKEERVVMFEKGMPCIREYYPDYSIIIFDAYPLENNKYKVILNDSIFFIDNMEGYTIFEKWENHIARAFIVTNILNPLRETPTEKGKVVSIDYKNSDFIVIEVEGDWIRVECDMECEGCPDEKLISGWIRWRKNDKLLVKLFYSC